MNQSPQQRAVGRPLSQAPQPPAQGCLLTARPAPARRTRPYLSRSRTTSTNPTKPGFTHARSAEHNQSPQEAVLKIQAVPPGARFPCFLP